MHCIPDSSLTDDDDATTGSKASGSRGRGKSRGFDGSRNRSRSGRRRRKTKPVQSAPPSTKYRHNKAGKKLRDLITRTFAKHKPATEASTLTEQDALLTVIHCPTPNDHHIMDQSQDSHSYYSTTSTPNNNMSHWNKLRQSVVNGEMLLQSASLMHNSSQAVVADYSDDDDENGSLIDPEETPEERAQIIQKAQDEIRQAMSFSLWQCLLAIAVYVFLTVLTFSYWLENWTLLESSYFAVVTFTTIGYGDVVPDTRYARLFTCVWALSGVACLGIALGVLGSNLIVVHEQHMEKAQGERQSRVIGLFDQYSVEETDETSVGYSTIEEGKRRVMFDYMEDSDDETNPRSKPKPSQESCTCRTPPALIRWTLLIAYISGVLYLIAVQEGWNLSLTVYYGLITASTVGYGDFCPETEMGRFLSILFIPVGVGIMGGFLEMVANSIIDYRRDQYTNKLHNQPLTLQQLRILDGDGDGEVTRAEFLEFMLVAMNQVDKGLLDQLKGHFNRLDVDGSGTINRADVAQMAKQRLSERLNQTVEEKLRLSHYKNYLLQQAHAGETTNSPGSYTTGVCSSSGERPSLQRKITQQTSNRSSGT